VRLEFFTSPTLNVTKTFRDRFRALIERESDPPGHAPWVDHSDGLITVGYYGTGFQAANGLNETINLIWTDEQFDKMVEAVTAAREDRFDAYMVAEAAKLRAANDA